MSLGEYVQYFSFFVLSFMAVATALAVILMRNPVHSALFFVLMLFHVAGIYVLLGAEFIAMIQLIVYAGAILVLFLFVIMLLRLREGPKINLFHQSQRFIAPVLGVLLLMEVVLLIGTNVQVGPQGAYTPEQIASMGGNVQALGTVLYTTYLLPFEVASMILLLGAIGAIVLARRGFGDITEPLPGPDIPVTIREERPEEGETPEPVAAGGDLYLPRPRNRYLGLGRRRAD